MKKVETNEAPAAIGPYSQAFISGGFIFTSGQIPLDPNTGYMVGNTVGEQAKQVIMNIGAILDEAGTSFDSVIKTTCYLTDMDDFAEFNAVYERFFISRPARSCVAVKELPKGALCEIEVVAELGTLVKIL